MTTTKKAAVAATDPTAGATTSPPVTIPQDSGGQDSGPEGSGVDSDSDADGDSEDFVTFFMADEHFAFPMSRVREIIRLPRLVHVPLGPPSLVGLSNLRGRVLPILDLRRCTGFATREPDDRTRVIVVDCGTIVGLVVDRVASVTTVARDDIDSAAAVQTTIRSDVLAGVIRSGGSEQIVSILDVQQVVQGELSEASFGDESAAGSVQAASWGSTSTAGADDSDDTLELVSFVVDHEEYALPVDRVQEIVQAPESVTEVPNSASHVLGVMDLRGRLLPVVSMRRIFGLPDMPLETNNRIVVVPIRTEADGQTVVVGIVMDTVRQVLRVPLSLVHPLPEFIARRGQLTEVESVCRLEEGKRLVSVLSADRMFDEQVRADLAGMTDDESTDQQGRDEMADETNSEWASDEIQLVVFRLGGEEFGVAVDSVQEIVRVPEKMNQVPKTLDFVDGLVNLRGTVLPVIDLRARLGLVRTARDERQRIVVLTDGSRRTGFIVDSVAEVLKLSPQALEPAPVLTTEQAELISHVANLSAGERMLLIIETARLLAGDHEPASAGIGSDGFEEADLAS